MLRSGLLLLAGFVLPISDASASEFAPWRERPSGAQLAHAGNHWVEQSQSATAGVAPGWRPVSLAIERLSEPGSALAGRVSALIVSSEDDGDHFLIGSSSGGLWRKSPTLNWHPISDTLPGSPAVGDVLQLAAGSLVVATGDPWRYPGSGIYISADDGDSWTAAELPFVPSSIYRLAQDRSNPAHLLAASANGLLSSDDGGQHWQLRESGHWTDIQQDIGDGQIWHGGGFSLGMMRSADGASSFTQTAAATSVLSGTIGRTSLAQSPAQPGLLFALVADFGNTNGIFRSLDSGLSWTAITPGPDVGWGQAFHTNAIAAHPSDASTLVVAQGGFKITRDALAAAPSWEDLGDTGHADTTRLVWSQDRLYAANDGGLFLVDLAAAAPTSLNDGLALHQVFATGALALDPNMPGRLWMGLQDNGVAILEWLVSPLLKQTGGCCDGGWISAAVGQFNQLAAALGLPFDRYLSLNGGQSFSRLSCFSGQAGGNPPVAFDPAPGVMPPLLYSISLHSSTGRPRLAALNLSAPCATATRTILIPEELAFDTDFLSLSPDPNRLHALLSPSSTSVDIRLALAQTPPGTRTGSYSVIRVQPPEARVGRAAFDPAHPGLSYWWSLTGVPALWRSSDVQLQTWEDLGTGLNAFGPGIKIKRVLAHPNAADELLMATNLGILRSVDDGRSWHPWGSGLPSVIDAVDLIADARTAVPELWLASYGRGLWRRDWQQDSVFDGGFEQ